MKVKEQSYNGQFSGYLVDGNIFFPKENCELIKQWIAQGNTPEPEFTEKELINQNQDKFRFERDSLLKKVDIAIYKAEDLGQDTQLLRTYRQALRDATIDWILPESVM